MNLLHPYGQLSAMLFLLLFFSFLLNASFTILCENIFLFYSHVTTLSDVCSCFLILNYSVTNCIYGTFLASPVNRKTEVESPMPEQSSSILPQPPSERSETIGSDGVDSFQPIASDVTSIRDSRYVLSKMLGSSESIYNVLFLISSDVNFVLY